MESSSNTKAKEDLQHARSLSGPSLKHVDSFIQIDSISIDLPTVNSKNERTPKCEHFSIRKYVSDMRKRDNKSCWPFESGMKSGPAELEPNYPLPPLDVPKFRWWKCRNCLQGICEKENGKAVLVNDLSGECNSDVGLACTHIALTRSETMVLVSDFKQILKLDNGADKREPLADTENESNAMSYRDTKEERDGGSNAAIKVPENGLEDHVYSEPPRPTPNGAEVNDASHGQEQQIDDAACHQLISANHEVNGVLGSPKCLQLQRDASQDCGLEAKAVKSSRALSATVEEVNLGSDAAVVQQNGHTSDDSNYPSSDSAEVGPGYRSRDKPGALHRRKFRKVRLLSDLLGQNCSINIESLRREESPLPAISDASEESGAKKVSRGRKMKRKFSQEDDYKTEVSNKEANEVEIVKGDAEENRKAVLGDALTSPRSIRKNGWTKHVEDTNSGLVKKKRKKNNEVESLQHGFTKAVVSEMGNDAYSLMGPLHTQNGNLIKHIDDSLRIVTKKKKKSKLAQESFNDKIGEPNDKAAFDVSAKSHGHDGLMGGEMGSSFSSVLKMDGSSCMCKKKSKMPYGTNHHTAQIPQDSSSNFREDSTRGIKFGLVQSGPATIRFVPDGDATLKTGTGLSSYDGKAEAECAFSFNYGPASTIPWHQVVPEEAQDHKKNSTHLEPNLAVSRLDGNFKKVIHHNHMSKEPIYSMPYPKEKKSYTSQFGDMGQFPMLQKEISGANNKGEIAGSREKSVAKNHNKISNEASARGACSDDIPMEIVELMAKIQYENSLHDTVKDQTHVDSRKSPSYQNLRFGGEYKNGDPNLSLREGSMSDQNQPKKVKKQGNAKQKAANISYSPHMYKNDPFMTQVEQNQKQNHLKGHGIMFSHYPEKPSMSKRNEDPMTNNYKSSSAAFEGLSACNARHVAGSEEPFNLWSSSTIPIARVPAKKNAPHKCVLPSSGLKSPGLKVSNKHEKPNKGFLLENSHGKNSYAPRPNGVKVQSPLRSSDFYSNENIPALHLLSLMDAHHGQNVNGSSRLGKQPSSVPCGYPPRELNFGAYQASETLRRPSSDYHTINFVAPGKYDQHLSAVPITGSSSSLFEPHENFRNGVMGQVPLKVREKGKNKCSDLIASIGGSSSQKYVTSGCIPDYNQQTNELIWSPNSAVFPPKGHTMDKSEKELFRSTMGSVWPPRYSLEMGICTVNRNPAEFSIPEVGNVYTIGGSELRLAKRLRAPEWSAAAVIDLDRPKRGRKKKIATPNHQQTEHPQVL